MTAQTLYFNGIDGATGRPLLPPLSEAEVGRIALGLRPDAEFLRKLKEWTDRYTIKEDPRRQPVQGVDPLNLAETGWGVIFPDGVAPAIRYAVRELLEHREEQAGSEHHHYYQELTYRPGETAEGFLWRHGAKPGPANPEYVPYYLLIVGDPQTIPYRFQYEVDVQYAVGRIHFERPEDYANYARSVVRAEQGRVSLPRQLTFFGVKNPRDVSTQRTSEELVEPLATSLLEPGNQATATAATQAPWRVRKLLGEQADKAQLRRLLGGDETPALLFTACHGVRFPFGHSRQLAEQGALVCQDWPGPGPGDTDVEPLRKDYYFSARDVGDDARPHGLIAFLFACHSAGTPAKDNFEHGLLGNSPQIAPHEFISRLPQRLLSHPNGGALAVVGHIDRAWTTSFRWLGEGGKIDVLDSTLRRLIDGHPLGSAMEYLNQYYAELGTMLCNLWKDRENLIDVGYEQFSRIWRANNDAQNFIILGDPAVRLGGGLCSELA